MWVWMLALTWSGGWMFTNPWMRWDPWISVREGWRECSLWLVMIRHTRLEWSTASSTMSHTPAATNLQLNFYTQTLYGISEFLNLLCAMCCCRSASGPCSCSGDVAPRVKWSRSSRRTMEGCLQTACSNMSCRICFTVSALLPKNKK